MKRSSSNVLSSGTTKFSSDQAPVAAFSRSVSAPNQAVATACLEPVLTLADKVQFLDRELDGVLSFLRDYRAVVEMKIRAAALQSRERAAELLDSSLAQVDRWTKSGELAHVNLDKRPRYRLEDLENFASSRVQRGRKMRPKKEVPVPESEAAHTQLQKHEKYE